MKQGARNVRKQAEAYSGQQGTGQHPDVAHQRTDKKIKNENNAKTFNFKERLVNVKLKDIDTYASEHMCTNWVTEKIKTLKKVC